MTPRRARWGTVLALALLAACARNPESPVPSPAAAGLRDPAAPVAAQVDAGPERLAGEWRVVQGAGLPPGAALRFAPGRVTIAGTEHALDTLGPGRFAVAGRPLWVHWLDADARTAALGDPGGAWVFVIDREGRPGERLAAARTILDWYGYDLGALR
ncbi:lipocalin [Roseivivax sp. CAU 1761]